MQDYQKLESGEAPEPQIPPILKATDQPVPPEQVFDAFLDRNFEWFRDREDADFDKWFFRPVGWTPGDPTKVYLTRLFCGITLSGQRIAMAHLDITLGSGPVKTSPFLGNREVRARIHKPKRFDHEGQPIMSDCPLMALYKFVQQFRPDDSWCMESEWQRVIENDCRDALARDEAADTAHERATVEHNIALGEAAKAKMNPTAALSEGIAAGVAAALERIGVAKIKPARP